MSHQNSETDSLPLRRPAGVAVISVVVVLEALALLAAAVWFVVELLTERPQSYSVAIFTVVMLLLLAAWLLAVGHFLFRGYRWPRSAALVWQLFMIVLGVTAVTNGFVPIGLGMSIPAAVAVVLLFTRPVVAFTQRRANSSTVL